MANLHSDRQTHEVFEGGGPKTVYLPTSFVTRFYDMVSKTHTIYTVLHEVFRPDLFNHENIVVLVTRPGNWACIWIDIPKRTNKYIDSYHQGDAVYTQAMRAYLMDFEKKIGIMSPLP